MMYRATMEDFNVYTKPWTIKKPWSKTDGPIFEYARHEGNYAMSGILGEREPKREKQQGSSSRKGPGSMQNKFKFTRSMSVIVIGAGLLSTAVSVWAHHAFSSEFDASQPLNLKGTVTRMEWINPHAWIHMDVKDDGGKVTNWMVECGSPNVLLRRGMTKTSVTEGMQIVVDGYRAKDGSNRANGRDVTFPNGTKLFLGSNGTGAPGDEPDK